MKKLKQKTIQEQAEWITSKYIRCFLDYYDITNDQGIRLDFKDHPFLKDIYKDLTPIIAIRKAAQVGMSTLASIKVMWVAKNIGLDVIYSLPAMNDVRDFVSSKTNRLIAFNPILQKWTEDKDSIEQKQIGKNMIHFRGTWTERTALMIPADLYVADEVDRSKQDVVVQFETRLQHSKFGWRWYFSNPSAPGVGVDKYWNQSDEKQWFVECKECGHEWYLSMENIMGVPPYFGCIKCKKELDRRNGRWIKRWDTPDKKVSGYQISLLMCPWVSAQYILDKKKGYSDEQFCNFVLGTPYVGKGNVMSQPLLFQNLTKRVNPQDSRCIIGVDTGVDIRYTIGNKYGLFYFGECKDYSELEKLLSRWSDAIMVIDQGGDIIGPRKLREKYPNRVFLCFYRADTKTDELITWNDEDGTVRADRNKCIQLVVDEFTEKRIPIYGTDSEWWDYWLHWSHIYRVEEYNENTGMTKFTWMRSDRDDWCFVAGTNIRTEHGNKHIEDVKVGDLVWTRNGLKRVRHNGMTHKDAEIYEARFSNGKVLKATGNHPFYVKGQGFVRLDSMVYGCIMEVWQEMKQSFLMISSSDDTQIQKQGHTVSTLLQESKTNKTGFAICMSRFGNQIMVLFLKVAVYITKMAIHLIMMIQTLWQLTKESIRRFMYQNQKEENYRDKIFLRQEKKEMKLSRFGEYLKKARFLCEKMLSNQSCYQNLSYSPVSSVGRMEVQRADRVESSVRINANIDLLPESTGNNIQTTGSVTLISVEKLSKKQPVYNLYVEDTHEYYANDILVHNCQATVYWRIGMSRFMDQFVSFSEPKAMFGVNGYEEEVGGGAKFSPKF